MRHTWVLKMQTFFRCGQIRNSRGKSPKVARFLFLGHKIGTKQDIAVLKRSFHWEQLCQRSQCRVCCEKKVMEVFVNTPFFCTKKKSLLKWATSYSLTFWAKINRKNSEKERKYKKIIVYSISFAVNEKYVEIFIWIVSQVKYEKYAKKTEKN